MMGMNIYRNERRVIGHEIDYICFNVKDDADEFEGLSAYKESERATGSIL